ncbi:MAG TPA: nicotinamide-nucleotide amidohydrolase family protein [Thiolinea sp.]|nr:nicotinamide-nucleotide amidohydrolase family protein [Thiolinea sp.]
MEKALLPVLQGLAATLLAQDWRLVTAESCTGGWIAKTCTDMAGSSRWFECGFVSYSNRSKQELLEVSEDSLAQFGAVSEVVAAEMARGAIANSAADVAIAVTGIAGPDGATPDKPLGTVCFGWVVPDQPLRVATRHFDGDREAVRRQSVEYALQGLLGLLR